MSSFGPGQRCALDLAGFGGDQRRIEKRGRTPSSFSAST
jgi:hypothetical protein